MRRQEERRCQDESSPSGSLRSRPCTGTSKPKMQEPSGDCQRRSSPDPRRSLNRHDAKDVMFPIFPSKNAKPVSGAFRSFVRCPPHDHFGFGDLGALAVDIFGLGLRGRWLLTASSPHPSHQPFPCRQRPRTSPLPSDWPEKHHDELEASNSSGGDRTLRPQPRIHGVADGIAEEVQAEHRQSYRAAGEDGDPGSVPDVFLGIVKDVAPGGGGGRLPQAEK